MAGLRAQETARSAKPPGNDPADAGKGEEMNLNSRQAKALRNIVFESAFLQGDFQVPGKLGVGIGKVTFDSLIELGLIERGESKRHHGAIGYRPTELGKSVENGTY